MLPAVRWTGMEWLQRQASMLTGALALVGLALLAGAGPVAAQGDTARARSVSTFEIELQRLTEEMNTQRRMQIEWVNVLRNSQQAALRRSGDSSRVRAEAQAQIATERLRTVASRQALLRRRLDSLCGTADDQPSGWMGLVMNGPSEYIRDGDGPMITHFLSAPVVESVEPGSPADKAGLEAGDVMVRLNGKDVRSQDIDFVRLLQPGAKIPMRVVRGSAERNVTILIERRPESFGGPCPWIDNNVALAFPSAQGSFSFRVTTAEPDSPPDAPRATIVGQRTPTPPAQPTPPPVVAVAPEAPQAYASPLVAMFANGSSGVAGAQLAAVDRDLGAYFNVDRGLLILSVLQGTPALRAGLKAGDVLLSADGVDLASAMTLQRVIRSSSDHAVKLAIMRGGKPRTITLRW